MNSRPLLIRAAAIADGYGFVVAPGAIVVCKSRIIARGSPQEIGEVPDARILDLPRSVVIPGLVNAHCHLDLTGIGPRPLEGSFVDWIKMVRQLRPRVEADIEAAVRKGIELSRAGGTVAIGDVVGIQCEDAIKLMADSNMLGVTFVEMFGIGQRQTVAAEALKKFSIGKSGWIPMRVGLQPHAPYSCGPEVYRAAATTRLPLMTHLAETQEEVRFVQHGDGPLADMLREFGVWDDTIHGFDKHPIDHVQELLGGVRCLAAHCNYIEPRHLQTMARIFNVAYCPRASAYFGHPHVDHLPHQYREMIEAGMTVALGTDSMIGLDTPDRLSVLDDMRLLLQRDGTDPITLLRMATINGALALGVDPQLVSMRPGRTQGLLALEIGEAGSDSGTDLLAGAIMNEQQPMWAHGPFPAPDSHEH